MMKIKASLLFVLLCCLPFSSCGPDPTKVDFPDAVYKVTVRELELGLSIKGSVTLLGDIPIPSGNINLSVSSQNQSAYLNTGLDFGIGSNNSGIAGAYIQFNSGNGKKLDFYFDVPLPFKKIGNTLRTENNYNILVDFVEDIPMGTFGYQISLYDSNGNVSTPVPVTVNVVGWGGDNDIVGDWTLYKTEPLDTYDEAITVTCTNNTTFDAKKVKTGSVKETVNYYFDNSDNFIYNYEYEAEELDIEASKTSCTAVYKKVSTNNTADGKWSYIKNTKDLTLVTFKETTTKTPDGDFFLKGKAEIIANELIITLNNGKKLFLKNN